MVYGKCEGDLITENMDRQKEILVKRDSTYMGRREKHRFNNTKKKTAENSQLWAGSRHRPENRAPQKQEG
jgi:hypothetical protein